MIALKAKAFASWSFTLWLGQGLRFARSFGIMSLIPFPIRVGNYTTWPLLMRFYNQDQCIMHKLIKYHTLNIYVLYIGIIHKL